MSPVFDHNEACIFSVWAPEKESMTLHLANSSGPDTGIAMQKGGDGYFRVRVDGVKAGCRYYYRPDGEKAYPDPASHFQPEGVHGPSEVVDHAQYSWADAEWRGLPLPELIFYEVHVGACTPEGSFTALIPLLDDLAAMGINAIELMPVAQFPGSRNWGYDGVFLYAVQNTYGGPEGLKKLVDACHQRGIAVFLDVVYNHLGKEGNYLNHFGPYFSDKYRTPWGDALNLDGPGSDGVRDFVTGNILHWAEHYHIDGLRLDAVHEIFDRNAITIWDMITDSVREWQERSGRTFYLVAESDLNSPRVTRPVNAGGLGFDAQWMDDFHHALYVLLDENGIDHYRDFGLPEQFAKACAEGFVHSGEYVEARKRRHGASSAGIPGRRFIVFSQNHDLPGNRPEGERLSKLVDFNRVKLAAAAVMLSPYVPLLFMGEEYGEETPFYFFSDFSDPVCIEAIREGRKKELAGWGWHQDPPDCQGEEAYQRSKLEWSKRKEGKHRVLLNWYTELIRLRKSHPLLKDLTRDNLRADLTGHSGLALHRYRHFASGLQQLVCLFNFSASAINHTFPYAAGRWSKLLSSADDQWKEPGIVPVPGITAGPATGTASGVPPRVGMGEVVSLPAWSVVVYEAAVSQGYQPIPTIS